jgi:hypothetical protein
MCCMGGEPNYVARSPPARKKKGGATEIGRVLRPAAEAGWRSDTPEGENRAGGGTNALYRVLLADHRQDLTSNTYLSYRGRLYRFLTSTQPSSGTRSISVASSVFFVPSSRVHAVANAHILRRVQLFLGRCVHAPPSRGRSCMPTLADPRWDLGAHARTRVRGRVRCTHEKKPCT